MISFVGAGPGDVELITVKGLKALEKCDVLIYAGSLVTGDFAKFCKKDCEVYDSAKMNLDEVIEVFLRAEQEGKYTVRLHTGDPSIYGAIREQIDEIKKKNIEFNVIPGVSSFTAAASEIGAEFTLPSISQTVILTRMAGRTPVPEKESIKELAKHKASMAIFLSVLGIEKLVEELKEGYGSEDTPVAVVYKATWEDKKVVRGTLKDIANKVKEAGITRQAQILVGDFLGDTYEKSLLYDKEFTHGYRKGTK